VCWVVGSTQQKQASILKNKQKQKHASLPLGPLPVGNWNPQVDDLQSRERHRLTGERPTRAYTGLYRVQYYVLVLRTCLEQSTIRTARFKRSTQCSTPLGIIQSRLRLSIDRPRVSIIGPGGLISTSSASPAGPGAGTAATFQAEEQE
jgi:hypothetical protein